MRLAEKIAFYDEEQGTTGSIPGIISDNHHYNMVNNFINKRDSIDLLVHNGFNAPDVLLAVKNGYNIHDFARNALNDGIAYRNFDGTPATKEEIIKQL